MKIHLCLFAALFLLLACTAQNTEHNPNTTNTPFSDAPATKEKQSISLQRKVYNIPALPKGCKYIFSSVFLEKGDMAVVNKINAALEENEKQAIVLNYGNEVFNTVGKSTQDLIKEEVAKWHKDLQNQEDTYIKEIDFKGIINSTLLVIEKNFYSMLGAGVRDHREKEYLVFDAKTGKQLRGAKDFFTNPQAVQEIIQPLYVKENGLIFDSIEGGVIFMLPEQIFFTKSDIVFYYTSKELGYGAEAVEFSVDKSLLSQYLIYK